MQTVDFANRWAQQLNWIGPNRMNRVERYGLGCSTGRQHGTASGGTVRAARARSGLRTRLVAGVVGRQLGAVTVHHTMVGQSAADQPYSHAGRCGCSKQQPSNQPEAASTTEGRHFESVPFVRTNRIKLKTAAVSSLPIEPRMS